MEVRILPPPASEFHADRCLAVISHYSEIRQSIGKKSSLHFENGSAGCFFTLATPIGWVYFIAALMVRTL